MKFLSQKDIQQIIEKSPKIDYVAEFFNDTIDKLVDIMGPSDDDLKVLESTENNMESISKLKTKVKISVNESQTLGKKC